MKTLLLILLPLQLFAQLPTPRLILPVGHTYKVLTVEFSPDNKRILTGASEVKLWDAETGALIHTFDSVSAKNYARFSPDGKRILIAHVGKAEIWSASSAELLTSWSLADTYLHQARFSPDGESVLTVTEENESVNIWDIESGSKLLSFGGSDVTSADYSYFGEKIVTGSYKSTGAIWDAKTGKQLIKLNGNLEQIVDVAFSPNDKQVVTASREKGIIVWNAETGDSVISYRRHWRNVTSVRFSPGGLYIMTGSEDESAHTWKVEDGKLVGYASANEYVTSLAFSTNSKYAMGLDDGRIQVRSFKNDSLLAELKGHTARVTDLQILSSSRAVTRSGDTLVRVWDLESGKILSSVKGFGMNAVSSDAKWMVTPTSWLFDTVTVWDLEKNKALFSHRAYRAAFSPDNKLLFLSGKETLNVFETGSWKEILTAPNFNYINHITFSRDGKKMVTAGSDSTVKLWDLEKKALALEFTGHSNELEEAIFSPDETRIISADKEGTILYYDIGTQRVLARMNTGSEPSGLQFLPGTDHVMVSNRYHDKFRIWDPAGNRVIFEVDDAFWTVLSADAKTMAISGKEFTDVFEVTTLKRLRRFDGRSTGFSKHRQDQPYLVTWNDQGTMIWNTITGEKIHTLKGRDDEGAADMDPGKGWLLARSEYALRIYDLFSGERIASLIAIDSNDHLVQLESKHYSISQNSAKHLNYVIPELLTGALQLLSFEQLDVRFNRPDRVLTALQSRDTPLISGYYQAYLKRVRRLGIDTSSFRDDFDFPMADIDSRDTISIRAKKANDQIKVMGR